MPAGTRSWQRMTVLMLLILNVAEGGHSQVGPLGRHILAEVHHESREERAEDIPE